MQEKGSVKETRAMMKEKAIELKEKAGDIIYRATKDMGKG